ncbi:MAG: xanthine dehydrogenase family protein molybdopterin-binding subunit [Halobacteriales archaeon]
MADPFVGRPLRRREDPPLLTGDASYTDDRSVPGMAHAAILRSQYGHARVESVETADAEALDGVEAVFTADDLEASAAPGVVQKPNLQGVDTPFPLLAGETVRYVGEPVAIAVAADRYAASDAVERIDVAYDRQDAVVDAREALDGGPAVHEAAPDNVAFETTIGDPDAVEEAFAAADATASVSLRNQRLVGNPMEPRAAIAEPGDDGTLALTLSSQAPHQDQAFVAETLGLDADDVEVLSPDVGGGFGIKGGSYADEALTAWAARQVGRPVKWTATRSEVHAADYQSRDWYLDGELAVDAAGRILAMRVDAVHNVGAYFVFPPGLFGNFEVLLAGQYDVPAIAATGTGVFTHTVPTAPYRGAGRPETIHVVERLVRQAARELEMDPVAFRRRNQIPPDAFPYETALGTVYDSGDYERTMDVALDAAEYDALRERQAALRERGRYLGIGVSCFVENTASAPGMGEWGRVRLDADGTATAYLGTHDHGQGHETTFSQLLADELGLDVDDVAIVEGDTRALPNGVGTFGSRSAALGGAAAVEAAEEVIERARDRAADELEAAPADVEFADGAFHVTGAPERAVRLHEVAERAAADGIDLEATAEYDPPNFGFSFGTHVAVVEIDPETGAVDIERYVAADDCGVVINPRLVEGQIHGGVAQGIGQALYEEAVYDDTGTLLTGTLQDYAVPKAVDVPEMETHETETPSPHNPLGVKGTGESGTIAATPAVANAVVDALEPVGVDDIDLPMTPEAVWQAMRRAD